MRRDLLEQLKPFHTYAILELSKAGQVAARPRQTFDKSGPHWIDGLREHNRHRAGQAVQDCSSWTIASYDHIWVERDKVPPRSGAGGHRRRRSSDNQSVHFARRSSPPPEVLAGALHVRLCFRIFRSKALQHAPPARRSAATGLAAAHALLQAMPRPHHPQREEIRAASRLPPRSTKAS